jgi:hypothetical protein
MRVMGISEDRTLFVEIAKTTVPESVVVTIGHIRTQLIDRDLKNQSGPVLAKACVDE